jgi:hypothetical protein
VQQVLGQAVGEVFVVLVRGHVDERKHGGGLLAERRGRPGISRAAGNAAAQEPAERERGEDGRDREHALVTEARQLDRMPSLE